jgi:sugar-phosphatase
VHHDIQDKEQNMPDGSHPAPVAKTYAAFLFDMDGTLINSIALVERVWRGWAKLRGVDPIYLLTQIHGVRSIDAIRALDLPGVDAAADAAMLLEEEMATTEGIVAISGVLDFLSSLPSDRWAIVTSAPRRLALLRLQAIGIPLPKVLIAAEDVAVGKPDPQCYRMGAEQLGFDPRDCLVFEDAPAGILAGERAGADVAVITATHSVDFLTEHLSVSNYDELVAVSTDRGIVLNSAINAGNAASPAQA